MLPKGPQVQAISRRKINFSGIFLCVILLLCLVPSIYVVTTSSGILPYENDKAQALPTAPVSPVYSIWALLSIATALITAALTLVDYIVKKDIATPVAGGIILCVGFFDVIPVLAYNGIIRIPASPIAGIEFGWLTSRFTHAFLLACGTGYFLLINPKSIRTFRQKNLQLARLFFIFALITISLITWYLSTPGFPTLKNDNSFISHPAEIIVLATYIFWGLFILPHFIKRYPSAFSRMLELSIFPAVFAEVFMAVHQSSYDAYFNIACFFKFLNYLIPLVGVSANYIQTTRKEKKIITKLNKEVKQRIEVQQALENREEELKQAQEDLEVKILELNRSNIELEHFAYIASHDLQEPLRKIKAFGERLKSKYSLVLPEEGRDYLSRMTSASERMKVLIDDLLTFSRIGRSPQGLKVISLKEVIEGVISDMEVAIEQQKAEIYVRAELEIKAFPCQIRQLFQNLISNSLKFAQPDKTPIITIEAMLLDKTERSKYSGLHLDRDYCKIIVNDNGIGFADQHKESIFVLFERLHSRNEYEGTGIGLAVCKKIVDNHSGIIIGEGQEGRGATFTIILPVD